MAKSEVPVSMRTGLSGLKWARIGTVVNCLFSSWNAFSASGVDSYFSLDSFLSAS